VDNGRLAEVDALLDQARASEFGALLRARELRQRAQEAEDRHALNVARMIAGRGEIALTELR
jgi:hypothetical protein